MNKGFTLVEILVATAIFMAVMVSSIGALFVTSNSAKKAKALHTAMDNVNYAVDTMSRSLRLGWGYYCTGGSVSIPFSSPAVQDCPMGESGVAFIPANSTTNTQEVLYIRSTNLNGPHSVQRCMNNTCTDLTSSEVDVKELKFVVMGTGSTDWLQPSVFIMMKGEVNVNNVKTPFAIQTLASQRTAE